jgi:haloacid dehalogenase superfamily, subfamily IA, variant 3 with third motif having DD or ED/haloacid dehalogenase superfamily, subfamily IA, variant 1 with third motif having Dx(3-4)D or Dx(3-4)E
MKRAIIFDLDGTLLDTLEDLKDSLNVALNRKSLPERTLEEVRQFVGNGIHKLIERAVPEGTFEEVVEQVFQDFRSYYLEHCEDKTCAYPGIPELLEELERREISVAIVSNKADAAVRELAKTYFPKVRVAIGEREGIARKPAPDSVFEAMRLLGVSEEEALYVGDSDVDIATAKNAGLPCVSVTWGFRREELLRSLNPAHIIHQPMELLSLL